MYTQAAREFARRNHISLKMATWKVEDRAKQVWLDQETEEVIREFPGTHIHAKKGLLDNVAVVEFSTTGAYQCIPSHEINKRGRVRAVLMF